MVLVACSFIAGKRISRYLELIGQQTLVILGMHAFPMIVMKVAGVLFFGNAVLSSLPFILLVSVVVLVVSYMMGVIISKYAPFMLSPRTTYWLVTRRKSRRRKETLQVKQDLNKRILLIQYNLLNLPTNMIYENRNDYGARHYDPCIMRFTTMDLMCERIN